MANNLPFKKKVQVIANLAEKLHGADSTYVESVPVLEMFRGQTAWEGTVEVFTLSNHPKAKRAYAWSYRDGSDEKFTAVLEVPPVVSPQTAVRASIVADFKKRKK